MLVFVKRFGLILLLALGLVFAYQNLEPLSQTARFRFNFYVRDLVFETPALPLVVLLIGTFLLGMVAAGFQGFYEKLARTVEIRKRDRRIRELERELEDLRGQQGADGSPALPGPGSPGQPSSGVPLEDNPTL